MKSMIRIAIAAAILFAAYASAQASAGFTLLANVTTPSYADTSCPLQSTCYYQVTAVDATGHESAPAACGATQICLGGNQAFVTMPSSGTHTVNGAWTASTTAGVTYNVYRHIGPLPAAAQNWTVN